MLDSHATEAVTQIWIKKKQHNTQENNWGSESINAWQKVFNQ